MATIFKRKPSQIHAEQYLPPNQIPELVVVPTSNAEIPVEFYAGMQVAIVSDDLKEHAYYPHPNGRKLRIRPGSWLVTEDYKTYWVATDEYIKQYYYEYKPA